MLEYKVLRVGGHFMKVFIQNLILKATSLNRCLQEDFELISIKIF